METKYAFVINPNAGVKKKINIEEFIASHFPKTIAYDIIIWENADDITPIVQQIKTKNYFRSKRSRPSTRAVDAIFTATVSGDPT